MRRMLLLSIFSLIVVSCSPATRPSPSPGAVEGRALDGLLVLIRDRLDVMHDVARSKWAKQAPIEDTGREAALLRDVADQGASLGLDPGQTRTFFEAQIEAAKLLQRADFRRWEAERHGPQGEPPDLARELRPRIDALNRKLLAALARHQALLGNAGPTPDEIRGRAEAILGGGGIDVEVQAAAIRPLITAGKKLPNRPDTQRP